MYDEAFKALADEHRRNILAALCQSPMVAGQLARLVRLAPNAVSFHLKWLRSAGLVTVQRRGKFLSYHAVGPALNAWEQHVHQLFSSPAEAALASEASPAVTDVLPMTQAATVPLTVAGMPHTQPRPSRRMRSRMRRAPVAPPIADDVLPTELL